MYVCICNAIRESDFVRQGRCVPGDAEAVYASLGKTPQCRQCLEDADEILRKARAGERELSLVA